MQRKTPKNIKIFFFIISEDSRKLTKCVHPFLMTLAIKPTNYLKFYYYSNPQFLYVYNHFIWTYTSRYAQKGYSNGKPAQKFDLDCDAFIIYILVIKPEKYKKKNYVLLFYSDFMKCVTTLCYTQSFIILIDFS